LEANQISSQTTKFESICALLLDSELSFRHALVIGCANGEEVHILSKKFNGNVTGIDIDEKTFLPNSEQVTLENGDVRALKFVDSSFDFIFSFHMLEHVLPVTAALSEMRRVAQSGSLVLTGTPNRQRLLGYFGADTTLVNKIRWNFSDWRMRVTGKWSNEKGAHAGFSKRRLLQLSEDYFGPTRDVTTQYYLKLYPNKAATINLLNRAGLLKYLAPSVYVLARVAPGSSSTSR